MKVQKRTGQIVDFDLEKIENAIKKAFDSKQVEYDPTIVESVDKLIRCERMNPYPAFFLRDIHQPLQGIDTPEDSAPSGKLTAVTKISTR